MVESIVKGIVNSNLVATSNLTVSDVDPARLKVFSQIDGMNTTRDNLHVVKHSDVIIIGVKPTQMMMVAHEISRKADSLSRKSFISIAAGICLADLEEKLPSAKGVIRVMPNICATVGLSATTFALGSKVVSGDDVYTACDAIFGSVGTVNEIGEELMDTSTGLSGSGPAFVFMFIEALADGGVRNGLSREVSLTLAAQTVLGSASIVLDQGSHPGELKDRVCSPGGTTIAGVEALEKNNFRYATMQAVSSAARRSEELSDIK
jgi:pyrroline-5-carboxylate reductase